MSREGGWTKDADVGLIGMETVFKAVGVDESTRGLSEQLEICSSRLSPLSAFRSRVEEVEPRRSGMLNVPGG